MIVGEHLIVFTAKSGHAKFNGIFDQKPKTVLLANTNTLQ